MRRLCCVWLLVLGILLAGCGGDPAPRTGLAPTTGAHPEEAAFGGADLPGRLLFVRSGVIWQWKGRTSRPLLGDGAAFQPAFSPDGRRIAYVARGNDYSDILLADASGAPFAQLTYNGSRQPINSLERVYDTIWAFYPAWAPAGESIAVATQSSPPEGDPPVEYRLILSELSVGDGARAGLYASENAQCGRSVYTPDGARLLFVRTGVGADGQQQLYQLDLASGSAELLANAPAPAYDPAISADGRWLALAAHDGLKTDIFVLPLAGAGTAQRLTDLGSARAPAFSPDMRQLAFLAIAPGEGGFDLWVADLEEVAGTLRAKTPRRLTSGLSLDADSGLSWAQ